MTENEYIDWIQGKHRLAPLDLTETRCSHITTFDTDFNFLKELLKVRRENARKVLACTEGGIMRESYVKYLEMIEGEIKKALILE